MGCPADEPSLKKRIRNLGNSTELIYATFVFLSAGHRSDNIGKESPDSKGQHTG